MVFKYSTPATVRRDQPLLLDVRHDYAGRVSDPDPVGSDVSSEVGSGSGQYQTGSATLSVTPHLQQGLASLCLLDLFALFLTL